MIGTQEKVKVLVFRSNILDEEDVTNVKPLMDGHPGIIRWNVDLHDIDNVLRIETVGLHADNIEDLLIKAGYFCKELPD